MTTARPEMLWEHTDAVVELERRFGFTSAEAAADWVAKALAEDYAMRVMGFDGW
jgi:hypothetical protein